MLVSIFCLIQEDVRNREARHQPSQKEPRAFRADQSAERVADRGNAVSSDEMNFLDVGVGS